ncbi:MAG: sulfatase [Gemmatales bacterium]|nr:MAG: sulfatase [Gemmatales bacterium]
MHCRHFLRSMTRRQMLETCANGFGMVALAALLAEEARGDKTAPKNPLAPKPPHFEPKAKNVIFLYMDGGPSQVDTFDYKPMLARHDGKDPRQAIGRLEPTQFNNVGRVMRSPWKFKQYGQSGIWVSDLFPYLARHVDNLCVIKSMVSKFQEHTFANYFLHTGSGLQGRPSMGAWVGYGLGTENRNLPGFIVLNGGLIPPGGLDNFGNGFLPAAYQGSVFNPGDQPVPNINRREASDSLQRNKLALLRSLDEEFLKQSGREDKLESAIANYETAYRMQMAVPEVMDLSRETKATKKLYGFEASYPQTRIFARQCLLARRLVERGVRFIELTCPGGNGDRWDQHSNLKDGHEKNCRTVDQPIAALLTDLQVRGLFDSTLVIWSGEFGRTPFAQGRNGRDHNPTAFSCWLAGGGVKGGISYGESDEWGYRVVQNRVEIHDLHATMLHLLGLDHTKTTFRFSSRDMRLTDVHGHVIKEILA